MKSKHIPDNFLLAVRQEHDVEQEAAEAMATVFSPFRLIHFNDNRKYDFSCRIGQKVYMVEVKHDYMSRYGNVALEVGRKGKPSGIMTTTSHFYVYKLYDQDERPYMFIFRTEDLRKAVEAQKYESRKESAGRDGLQSVVLFDRNEFMKLGRRLPYIPMEL